MQKFERVKVKVHAIVQMAQTRTVWRFVRWQNCLQVCKLADECRRSAVSKQACRILGLLSAALGPAFDLWAVFFLPILFKIAVITVQVRFAVLWMLDMCLCMFMP